MPVKVSREVLDGLEDVRKSGVTNMFDRKAVQFYANKFKHFATVTWIEENPKLYAEGIFNGFEAE